MDRSHWAAHAPSLLSLVLAPPRDACLLPSLSLGFAVAANSAGAGPGPPPPQAVAAQFWQYAADDNRLDSFFSRFSRFSLGGAAVAAARSGDTDTSRVNSLLFVRVSNSLAALKAPLRAPFRTAESAPAALATIRMRLMGVLLDDEIIRLEAAEAEPLTTPPVLLAQIIGNTFTRDDLALLEPGMWLNDSIINFYVMLLRKVGETCIADGRTGACAWTFSSFFYTRLIQHASRYDFPGIARWTKTVDVFAYERLLIPINRSNTHWALAVIDMRKRTVSYYDSLRGTGNDVTTTLCRWLGDEYKAKKDKAAAAGFSENDIFKSAPAPDGLSRQRNGVDCGVFVCAMLTCLLYDVLPLETLFTQAHIGLWRRKVAAACLAKTIPDASRA